MREYKQKSPLVTIANIRDLLSEYNITTIEKSWIREFDQICSVRVEIAGTQSGQNGKATNYEFALASAYGEVMERLQMGTLFGDFIRYRSAFLKENGFACSPDEEEWGAERLMELDSDVLECFKEGGESVMELKLKLEELITCMPSQAFSVVPFYNVKTQELDYLPEQLVAATTHSTGWAAGNSILEAVHQAISEIFERYSTSYIALNDLSPPTISDEFLSKYPKQLNMINDICNKTGFDIIVKDFSAGLGLPVVAVLLFSADKSRHLISVASETRFDIALERCLTELWQGVTINSMNRKLIPRGRATKSTICKDLYNDDSLKENEIFRNFVNKSGVCSTGFWQSDASYQGCYDKVFRDTASYADSVKYFTGLILSLGKNIYIRDNSFMGFPTVAVFVPGMNSHAKINYSDMKESILEFKSFIKFSKLTNQEILKLMNSMKRRARQAEDVLKAEQDVLHLLLPYKISPKSSMASISVYSFYAACHYALNDIDQALENLEKHIKFSEENADRTDEIYYQLRDFWYLQKGMSGGLIEKVFTKYHGKDVYKQISQITKESGNILSSLKLPDCISCEDCTHDHICMSSKLAGIYNRINIQRSKNIIDQNHFKELFL